MTAHRFATARNHTPDSTFTQETLTYAGITFRVFIRDDAPYVFGGNDPTRKDLILIGPPDAARADFDYWAHVMVQRYHPDHLKH